MVETRDRDISQGVVGRLCDLPGHLPVARTEGRGGVPAPPWGERAHQPAAPGRGRDGGLHVSGVGGRINTRTELGHKTSSHSWLVI